MTKLIKGKEPIKELAARKGYVFSGEVKLIPYGKKEKNILMAECKCVGVEEALKICRNLLNAMPDVRRSTMRRIKERK